MQNRDRKRSNQQNARTRVYVTMSCSHNRLAVREEEESFSVTQHVSDLSFFFPRREATEAFRTVGLATAYVPDLCLASKRLDACRGGISFARL